MNELLINEDGFMYEGINDFAMWDSEAIRI